MNELENLLKEQYGAAYLAPEFAPYASYFDSMDYVEYLTIDGITISDRIDEFLTLIWDENSENIVGFKLKGFKCFFNENLKVIYELTDNDFISLVSIIEMLMKTIGDDIFENEERASAYRQVHSLAANNEAILNDLPMAA